MEPSLITDLTKKDQQTLLSVARESIHYHLKNGQYYTINLQDYSTTLQTPAASFVSIYHADQLRGCIGHLDAELAMVEDVGQNAVSAATRDYRFPPIEMVELNEIRISISILTPMHSLIVSDEKDLYRQLVPHQDGLLMEYKQHRATFLPVVWEQLNTPELFLEQLKIKAGLPFDFWHPDLVFKRYHSIYFSE